MKWLCPSADENGKCEHDDSCNHAIPHKFNNPICNNNTLNCPKCNPYGDDDDLLTKEDFKL